MPLAITLASFVGDTSPQIRERKLIPANRQRQAELLILTSPINVPSQDGTFRFSHALHKAMNFTVDILEADRAEITNARAIAAMNVAIGVTVIIVRRRARAKKSKS